MECQGYRHSYTAKAKRDRASEFKQLLKIVKADRDKNGENAWETRRDMLNGMGLFAEAGSDADDETEQGNVAFDDDEF